jgi:ATP-dependent Lon protease
MPLFPSEFPHPMPDEVARLSAEPDPERRLEALRRWFDGALTTAREEGMPPAAPAGPMDVEARRIEELVVRSMLPEAARRRALREIDHLRHTGVGSAEAGRIRNWIEWVLELPWDVSSPDPGGPPGDFSRVLEVLARTHTGLAEAKNRVTEFLAVRRLGGAARGTVLCFAGPPGTGKTSMGRAVAEALGREFVHVPVGGMKDESELRGRHHTHPGGAPGRILSGLFRAGTSDPVVLLDEIDKVEFGRSGDTGGVLLEILDPEQNREFQDRYLGVSFDLSRCVFLVTANDTESMPETLLDRLEVIHFGSYTESEKLAIAREHLIPRARAGAGLDRYQFKITPGALIEIVRSYTEEAGVRQLQRTLDSLARKAAVAVVRGFYGLQVRKSNLFELLGPGNVDGELHLRRPLIGVTAGLAWTSAGGAMLPIEALLMPGSGRMILTGSIGDVMRESVQTAVSYARMQFGELGLEPDALESLDLHLHFPSGATPKDGPSAGIAIAVSLISLLTRTPVRHDLAMTGEISLRGAVLPVGGVREKLLGALRAGVRSVVVPARNAEEVLRLPAEVRQRLEIHAVDDVQDALAVALMPARRSRVRALIEGRLKARRATRRAAVRAMAKGRRTRGRRR